MPAIFTCKIQVGTMYLDRIYVKMLTFSPQFRAIYIAILNFQVF